MLELADVDVALAECGKGASVAQGVDSDQDPAQDLVLQGVHVRVLSGSVVAVSGAIGSGKSTLLKALIDPEKRLSRPRETSKLRCSGVQSVAYVSQSPWIIAGTIRDNIVMDRGRLVPDAGSTGFEPDSSDLAFYQECIEACQLTHDLALLPEGDSSQVGEGGAKLSGGQRQRISLARALYSRAQLVLLDDALSALDATVAGRLWQQAILGVLKRDGRIVIISTSSHRWVAAPGVDQVLQLRNGSLQQHLPAELRGLHTKQTDAGVGTGSARIPSAASNGLIVTDVGIDAELMDHGRTASPMEWGRLAFHYLTLFGSRPFASLTAFAFIATYLLQLVMNMWLAAWSSYVQPQPVQMVVNEDAAENLVSHMAWYAQIYAGLAVLTITVVVARNVLMTRGALRASEALQRSSIAAVLRAPCAWLDNNPVGMLVMRCVPMPLSIPQ